MGKRPRTPHFISGIGDGNINNNNNNNAKNKPPHGGGGAGGGGRVAPNDDIFGGGGISPQNNNNNNNNNINSNHNIQNNNLHISKMNNNDNNNIAVNSGGGGGGGGPGSTGTGSNTAGNGGNTNVMIRDRYIRKSRNERLARLEEPLLSTTEHWREVFGSGDPAVVGGIKHPGTTSFGGVETGHWQASAFAILGMIVVISAIFLHFVSDNTHEGTNTPYHYRRRQRQRRREYKKKKKTDEWSDDEEQNILQNSMHLGSSSSSVVPGGLIPDYGVIDDGETQMSSSSNAAAAAAATSAAPMYPYYYHQPPTIAPRFSAQAYPRRKLDPNTPPDIRSGGSNSKGGGGGGGNNNSSYGVVPAYKSPSVGMSTPGGGGVHRRGVSPRNSFSSTHSHPRSGQQHQAQQYYVAPSGGHHHWGQSKISSSGSFNSSGGPSPRATPLSGRLRVPTTPDAKELFPVVTATGTSSEHGLHVNVPLPTPPEEDELYFQQQHKQHHGSESISSQQPTPHRQNHLELNALPLGESSSFPSFASAEVEDGQDILTHGSPSSGDNEMELGQLLSGSMRSQQHHPPLSGSGRSHTTPQHSFNQEFSFNGDSSSRHHHQRSLLLSPGNYDETPLIGNARRLVDANALNSPELDVALMPPLGNSSHHPIASKTTTTMTTTPEEAAMATTKTETTEIPYIPALEIPAPRSNTYRTVPEPPRSILMDELRLVQMETGNSMHWRSEDEGVDIPGGNHADMSEASFADDALEPAYNRNNNDPLAAGDSNHSESGSNISIPSGDPRKNIPHKRGNLTDDTDASGSLQGRIPFQDLQLIEVIGGGGFGQVWRASWRGTPVAVKVLTGSAQATHVAKAIIEEFKAEINLLKGMRHPNICLYMGACVDPPNRAIITELAANGSVWDALRLPLMPPYVPSDGTQNGCWPEHLYAPDQTHGAPPTSAGMHSPFVLTVPIPPKGTWPWELVKRVACGAARGMAYLHGGKPPVLHRDLKSANLLLDESYTTKVCDFGLSRLKAKERSMTGNCGTVQWMAPEVLANMTYNEKADVYSFGIVLWELLSRECPYDGMTAIQCALAVLNRDKRPDIPKWCPPSLHALIKSCVKKEPDQRPSFTQIILALDAMG